MSFRRTLVPALVGALALIAVPAQARYGMAPVDTWARSGDRVIGHHSGAGRLDVRATVGSTHRVLWSVQNLGGGEPKLHHVTFTGCASDNGFDLHYISPSGKDVTGAVTHAGYVADHVDALERAWLIVRVASTARGRTLVCDLEGDGMHADDVVHLRLAS